MSNNKVKDGRGGLQQGNNNTVSLNLDSILATQPELGPSIPDGGYGWVVFMATLFFQLVIPNVVVNLGIFLAFSKLENGTTDREDENNMYLWSDRMVHVPLFLAISRGFLDSFARALIAGSTWPRLVQIAATCLMCAGLLFVWMGMTGLSDDWLYAPAGILTGAGVSLLMVQPKILLSQYFRLKLASLNASAKMFEAIGFIVAPIILAENVFHSNLSNILLWYQAIVLQGLIVSTFFRKPTYLKSRYRLNRPYHYVSGAIEADEEDIFSKNSCELQIKRQTSTGSTENSKITLPIGHQNPSTSNYGLIDSNITPSETQKVNTSIIKDNWEKFDQDDHKITTITKEYNKVNDPLQNNKWETFKADHEYEQVTENGRDDNSDGWEQFDTSDEEDAVPKNTQSLSEEMSKAINHNISPLFSSGPNPVNNNTTYAYDDDEIEPQSNVFVISNQSTAQNVFNFGVLKELTFYKSLLMAVTNRYSTFVFYTLFPTFLYAEGTTFNLNMKQTACLVGALSFVRLAFAFTSHWIRIGPGKRALVLWILSWFGTIGAIMISDYTNEAVLMFGAMLMVLSIVSLEHFTKPLLGLTAKGDVTAEYALLSISSSLSLLVFLIFDMSFKDCFRLVALLHFCIGALWFSNYIYRKFRN